MICWKGDTEEKKSKPRRHFWMFLLFYVQHTRAMHRILHTYVTTWLLLFAYKCHEKFLSLSELSAYLHIYLRLCTIHAFRIKDQPDWLSHSLKATKIFDRRILCRLETSIYGFWDSKIGKRSVGKPSYFLHVSGKCRSGQVNPWCLRKLTRRLGLVLELLAVGLFIHFLLRLPIKHFKTLWCETNQSILFIFLFFFEASADWSFFVDYTIEKSLVGFCHRVQRL